LIYACQPLDRILQFSEFLNNRAFDLHAVQEMQIELAAAEGIYVLLVAHS
jgi:hypothetical protein